MVHNVALRATLTTAFRALALIAGSLMVGSCGDADQGRMIQTSGLVSASLEVSPDRPVPMGAVDLRLALSSLNDEPIRRAGVVFYATMPGMVMPESRFDGNEESPGVYRARTIFTMAGQWRLRIEIALRGRSIVFVFDIATV